MTDPTTPNPQADELVERIRTQPLLQAFFRAVEAADPKVAAHLREANEIGLPDTRMKPLLDALDAEFAGITADRARIEQLEMALAGVLNCIGDLPLDRWQYNAIVEARTALTSERGG